MDHRFDLYLNGHEHDLEYALYPYDQYPETIVENFGTLDEFKCEHDVEHIFNPETLSSYSDSEVSTDPSLRKAVFNKGDAIHQITTGTTGFDLYPICLNRPSMGRWRYTQNKLHGFTQVHADVDQISLKIKGVDEDTKEIKTLYEVIINN